MDNDLHEPAGNPDPIVEQSLSGPLLVFSALLFLALAWAIYDEMAIQRPWKAHQRRFARLYRAHLEELAPRQLAVEKAVQASPEFQKIEEQLRAAEQALGPKLS